MPYLLDAMSKTGRNTCSCAFALYRLSASYTGPTVDVYYAGTTTSFYADIYGNLGTALNATGTAYLSLVTATGGYITKWYDQSGNGNHATQAYTNAPSLNYTSKFADFTTYSGASYMNLPNGTVPEKIAYTMICKHGLMNGTNGGFIGGGANAQAQGNNMRINSTAGYYNYWYSYDAYMGTTVTAGNVVTFKFDGLNLSAGGTTYGYLNSVLTMTTPNASRAGYSTGLSWNGQVGNEVLAKTTGDVAMNGQMYYMFAFNSALSDTDRFAAETLSPYNKISFIPTTGPIDFLNVGAATNQTSGPIDLGTLQSQYKTFGGGAVDLNTCYSLVNGFNPAWCMDAANYQSGTVWKDANTINNYDMTINASAYTPSWLDGTPTMRFDGAFGAAKYVVGGTLTTIPFTTAGTTMVCFSAINNLKGTSASYDWDWRTLYRVGGSTNPYHPVIIEYGGQNSGSSRMGDYIGYFSSSGTDIVTGPVPVPYAYQQQNMLVHKFRNTSPYYEYQLNNVMTTYTITDVNASLVSGSGTAAIGQWHNNDAITGSGSQWWGNVSSVFMYSSILTNAQIQDLYTRFCPRFYGFNNPALGVLPVTSGLVGWYTGESWTGSQWTDLSGSGNHVTSFSGTISTGTFTNSPLKFVYAGTSSVVTWPSAILPSTYTLFHVTRYGNAAGTGTTYRRILTGVGQNWLSGFWNGFSGVAYHDGWLTQTSKTLHATQWVISSDQNNLYRSQGYQRGTGGGTDAPQTYSQLCINTGVAASETSDWSIASVVVFNRTLSTTEIQNVEKWLNIRYNVVAAPNLTPILVNPGTQSFTGGGSFTITQNVVGTGGVTWAISPTTGVSFSSTSDTSATVAVASGTAISTQNYTVTATNPSGVPCSVVFSLTNTPGTLYTMTFPFTFTPMGATGVSGPTSITYGASTPGTGTGYVLTLGTGTSAGMQLWTVPTTRTYTFTLVGAGGGAGGVAAGKGASITSTLSLTAGHIIRILVGQKGTSATSGCPVVKGGAGGASWVYNNTTSTLLMVAGGGGGGGGGPIVTAGQADASTSTTAKAGDGGATSGAAGTGTNGGSGASPACTTGGGGGGGYTGNGGNGVYNGVAGSVGPNGGTSFTNGGTGGTDTNEGTTYGGFGGGGAAGNHCGGGGGGYAGGGGGGLRTCSCGDCQTGGGGSSYSSATITSSSVTNTGDGSITIT